MRRSFRHQVDDYRIIVKEIADHSDLRIIKEIGSGAFSSVFLALDTNEKPVAVKYFSGRNTPETEVYALEKLKGCQYIIQMINFQPLSKDTSIIVQECFDSVPHHMYWDHINITQLKSIARMMLIALKEIHSHNLVHCDFKLGNILVSPALDDLRVIDFGCAQELSEHMTINNGARAYRPPEQLLGSQKYNEKADIWALGICILQIAANQEYDPWYATRAIFQASNMASTFGKENMIQLIKDLGLIENQEIISKMSDTISLPLDKIFNKVRPAFINQQLFDFLKSIFVLNPNDRPSAAELLNHPFITT